MCFYFSFSQTEGISCLPHLLPSSSFSYSSFLNKVNEFRREICHQITICIFFFPSSFMVNNYVLDPAFQQQRYLSCEEPKLSRFLKKFCKHSSFYYIMTLFQICGGFYYLLLGFHNSVDVLSSSSAFCWSWASPICIYSCRWNSCWDSLKN